VSSLFLHDRHETNRIGATVTHFVFSGSYDVYTPTRNIVFHDYGDQMNGHGKDEWFKHQLDWIRKATLKRVQTVLQMAGGETDELDQANLGLYGLGKRRSLKQLQLFTNIDLETRRGNFGREIICAGIGWVPYDASISPTDNLFDHPDSLDPQPEYPLRTELIYYRQLNEESPLKRGDKGGAARNAAEILGNDPSVFGASSDNVPSTSILFVLWIFGLFVWYVMFSMPSSSSAKPNKSRPTRAQNLHKDV
jgi:hypothetical protein